MIAPAARPVSAPAQPYYTNEQIKIAALLCLSNAQAQIAHALLQLNSITINTDDVLLLLSETVRASSQISSTLIKIKGE